MNLVKRSPFDLFFNDLMGEGLPAHFKNKQWSEFAPTLNFSETDKEYKLSVELPGLSEEDFEILVEEDVLRIKGEKRNEEKEESENFYRVESSYGSFERAVRLPKDADHEKAVAKFRNGILKLNFAKTQPVSTARRITVKS